LKKAFAGIVTIITTALIIISTASTLIFLTGSATADTKANSAFAGWQLTVTGLVENPLNLNGTEIVAMPKSTVNAAIICVDFPSNIVAQGTWTGVRLRTLLEEATPLANVLKVAFYAADGYSTDLPVETAMHDDILLAYEKDGIPLNDLRLVVPGKWGYKWISQLTRIELVDYNFLGFWESRGYSDEANVSAGSSTTNRFPPLPTVDPSNPSPSNPPATSPSPSPSQSPMTSPAPSDQTTPTSEPLKSMSITSIAVYAIAVIIAVALVLVLTFVRKRTQKC
jgi:hypothetical protein